ncbi:ATP-dependent RNA helicase DbpA [Myxococcota bacterium]|nr:ATP-dependent RNA helicase DbpA [Myxococcota bacterium]MBU1537776.1 ATP-dependent RNA helicase DbpA [Myxococcota bacterium]
MCSFSSLPLSPQFLKNLADMEYNAMTPIQEESLPAILEGCDVLARAKTGSGKTAAFGIGILHNINLDRYRVQALVLCPTRELAEQVTAELRLLARYTHNIKIMKITGGMPLRKQQHSLSHEAHIIVGTPGRVLALLQANSLQLNEVSMLVLDEADRMLDMGFIDPITEILSFVPQERQTLFFSATLPDEIRHLSKKILRNPRSVSVDEHHDASVIEQHFHEVHPQDKGRALMALLSLHRPESSLIFCNTKEGCRTLGEELMGAGFHALVIHGDLEQKERTEVLIRFSNGSSRVLVATDVAARGLDISDLSAVFNYDLPLETETYVHRIGRTGRAGRTGLAISLMKPVEKHRLTLINEFLSGNYRLEPVSYSGVKETQWFEPPMVTLSINGGRRNKISAGDLLGALTARGGIEGSQVGRIDRQDYITFVAVKREVLPQARKILAQGRIKGNRFKVMVHEA